MDMNEKARYPGDPLGQAAVAGSVNGTDVRNWDFEDIMDLLEDFIPDPDVQSTAAFKGGAQRARKHQQVDFPVTIEYVEMKPMEKGAGGGAPAAPPGAWMPRLSGWSDEDLMKERQRAMAMPEPAPGYNGPRYTKAADIDDAWLQRLMQFQQTGGLIPKKDAYLLVLDVIVQLKSEQTMNRLQVGPGQKLTVFGDLHGQYFDFMNILSMAGMPSPN
eukprot:symbB.v1.2.034295.t1/scaffold4401.1/size40130/5